VGASPRWTRKKKLNHKGHKGHKEHKGSVVKTLLVPETGLRAFVVQALSGVLRGLPPMAAYFLRALRNAADP
jgi:hypothetical protein